jgi:hypothetical protein
LDLNNLVRNFALISSSWTIHRIVFTYKLLLFSSKDFAAALQRLGAQTELILFDGKTHSDLFLQVSAELDVLFYSCYDWFTYCQPNCEF